MFDFVKYRSASLGVSVLILVAFVLGYTQRGFKYSVDFTGGTEVLFKFDKHVPMGDLQKILDNNGLEGAVMREFTDTETLIRVKEFSENPEGFALKLKGILDQNLSDNNLEILGKEAVGPAIGASLRNNSLKAVLISLILMLIYIAVRFWSVGFALGAVLALFHDAVAILACFLLLDKEISINVIGAILATLGYSINDTIVIFSRIRENMEKERDKSMTYIVNLSINQTLRRTLFTSITTALVVASLLILGGEILRSLSLALLLGIIFGTYSSIYIASSVMLLFAQKNK